VWRGGMKSGPSWGSGSEVAKMYRNVQEGIATLRLRYPDKRIVAVNGCMYGKDKKPRKAGKIKESGKVVDTIEYWKLCGQDFWEFISDNPQLYVEIIEPLGYRAKKRNMAFQAEYDSFLNRLLREFLNTYANEDGSIAWERLTEFVSRRDSDEPLRELTST
ncbi:MAG: PmeII family type II restriction endonuclease, partial [Chloroflexi bacterium]|nr:PmeII family type II restriction endonuclease [Chloroflexota bacterium]